MNLSFFSLIFCHSFHQKKWKAVRFNTIESNWWIFIFWLKYFEFILATMDNNHYFGLYLIRIKHGLVLFSLLLTAFQSLVYLLLALVSEKVNIILFIFSFSCLSFSFLALFISVCSRSSCIYRSFPIINCIYFNFTSWKVFSCT